jgi:cation diffusion facilitator CzcD-associated flavoprotein CzcO
MLEWLIIGGGVHGTFISHYLTAAAGVPRERLRVLDPEPEPLARWYHCCANIGMRFMRSPDVHHLDLDPMSLRNYCFATVKEPHAALMEPYGRPSFALFREHTAQVIARHRLGELRMAGRAQGLGFDSGHATVETDHGRIVTKRIVLAIGTSDHPHWPEWARELQAAGAPIDHVFSRTFQLRSLRDWEHATVIGGGITAVQTALALAERAPGRVSMITRHSLRIEMFDSDPCWIGALCMQEFERATHSERRRMIAQARNRGSVPREIATELFDAIQEGRLSLTCGEIAHVRVTGRTRVQLTISDDDEIPVALLNSDLLILATGFDRSRPGGEWLDRTIGQFALPCHECGYPIVDANLRWHPGLYVAGPLAELEVGPVARNIIGARHAARRLAAA